MVRGMKINFKDMSILENKRKVKIIGYCEGISVEIELSILQLAKVFRTDRKVLKRQEKYGWGNEEFEDKCRETKKLVENYPNINILDKSIKFGQINLTQKKIFYDKKQKICIQIYAEDIFGWNNEGLIINFQEDFNFH